MSAKRVLRGLKSKRVARAGHLKWGAMWTGTLDGGMGGAPKRGLWGAAMSFEFEKFEFANSARRKIKCRLTTASILGGAWVPGEHGTQSGPVGVGVPSPGKLFSFTRRTFCPGFGKSLLAWQVLDRC